MMQTPAEAKEKWCPFALARANDSSDAAVNRCPNSKADPDCLCIADGCMAWLWGPSFGKAKYGRCGLIPRAL